MYNIKTSLPDAEVLEADLDRRFSRWYLIRKGNRWCQKNGIDRLFVSKMDGARWLVEYKADSRAASTGRVFVELVSVDWQGVQGWAYTSLAHWLITYIPALAVAYVMPITTLKPLVAEWREHYEEKTIPNEGRDGSTYNTIGICVPIPVYVEHCRQIVQL